MFQTYLELAQGRLDRMQKDQAEKIRAAAQLVGDVIADGKNVYTFGSGHSQLLAREISERAGGLAPVFHLPDPTWGLMERIEGYGEALFQVYPVESGEVIFIISNSGRNPEPIEAAIFAREHGLKVIVVTSLEHSQSVESRHSSGKLLYEFGDIVLDTGAPKGDAAIAFEGLPMNAGALSTVLGAAIMNAVMVEAIQYLLDQGITPPVLISANIDGSDAHNEEIMQRYKHMAWAPRFFF
jgi:uncharacterized phosphosugar-binding protein